MNDIAHEIGSPVAFTAKLLQNLRHHQLITSERGVAGGFTMPPQKRETITIKEVVLATDGKGLFENCTLGLKRCSTEYPCPLHYQLVGVRQQLDTLLNSLTVSSLLESIRNGKSFFKLPEP